MLIDTHCHLQDPKAFPDPAAELKLAQELGVGRLVVVGTGPDDWVRAIQFAETYENVWAIVGWHPNYTAEYDPSTLEDLEQKLAHPKVLALGEIGLDWYWDYAPREKQYAALNDQLDLAHRLGKSVVFHGRDAYSDLLDVLEKRPQNRYLFHCFAGNAEEAARGVALGSYFGVDGPVSYKKSDELRAVLKSIPPDRLVIETDSPYMAPVPYRGKPNRPAYVAHVNEALASTLGLTVEQCGELTTENAVRFFGF